MQLRVELRVATFELVFFFFFPRVPKATKVHSAIRHPIHKQKLELLFITREDVTRAVGRDTCLNYFTIRKIFLCHGMYLDCPVSET